MLKARVTCSNFDNLTARYATEIIIKLLVPDYQPFVSYAMQHGIDTEAEAITEYARRNLVLVEKSELTISKDLPFVSGTCDGLIGDDGIVEIKCPQLPAHFEYIINPQSQIDKYQKQIQGYLWLYDRQWCDLVTYNPQAREFCYGQVRVNRCEETIAAIKNAVLYFYKTELTPLLKFFKMEHEIFDVSKFEIEEPAKRRRKNT